MVGCASGVQQGPWSRPRKDLGLFLASRAEGDPRKMNPHLSDIVEAAHQSGRIVVGVDGSEHADRAIVWAARRAALERRPLTLLHAFDPLGRTFVGALELEGDNRLELRHALRRAARITLDEAVQRVHEIGADLVVHAELVDTDPRQALVDASKTAHLLVVGSRGRGPLRGLLLGSVSLAVSQLAECPTIVCRPRRAEPDTARVLVGADGSAASRPVIDFAFREASLRGVPLTVMHCFWQVVPADSSSGPVEEPADMRLLLAESVAGFRESYPDVDVHLELARGLVDQVLVSAAPAADLLVVGRRHKDAIARLLHASMAAAVLERAAGTVAVVPEAEHVLAI
jgi:nucleotide-binding universal stress UspA family protein